MNDFIDQLSMHKKNGYANGVVGFLAKVYVTYALFLLSSAMCRISEILRREIA